MNKHTTFYFLFFLGLSFNSFGQSTADFPWLSSILNEENCCFNNSAAVYTSVAGHTYVYVSNAETCGGGGGTLYNADGVVWCEDRQDLDCLSFYGMTLNVTIFQCNQASEFDFFAVYPWLNQVVDLNNCCNNQTLTAYRDANNHEFVCVSVDPNCTDKTERWYYQTGELFCENGVNYDCPSNYGFGDMDIISTYNCTGDVAGGLTNFTVTIENVMEGRDFFNSGTIGLILPGESSSYSFNAGVGHLLSFATMFVQSNDLFIGPGDNGLNLYDENGNAVTGDITAQIDLWDAGTEINEAPGEGPNQAPRQTGANTGEIENGLVQLIENVQDGFTYPQVNEMVEVSLTHDGGTMFTLTINNISGNSAIPSPFAPGVWVINSANQTPLFQTGVAASIGLERIAEDGDNAMMDANISSRSGLVSPFAPGAYGINMPVFINGQASASTLEALAEDGNPTGFTNAFAIPTGASNPAPIFPGGAYTFSFSAKEGDLLSFATMLVQSNDWFVGANELALFINGTAISGDITNRVNLYESGTELDEYPGAGGNQAPRQSGPNTGVEESGVVSSIATPILNVPSVANMVKITISN